jgi:hypothetical protein
MAGPGPAIHDFRPAAGASVKSWMLAPGAGMTAAGRGETLRNTDLPVLRMPRLAGLSGTA